MGACCSSNSAQDDVPPVKPGFRYQTETCAMEFWEPIALLEEGSISNIHLVRRRKERITIPYKERVDIMAFSDARDQTVPQAEVYVLKSVMKDLVDNDRLLREMRREISTLSFLQHPNIIQLYEAYERKRHIYLILEFSPCGDLNGRHPSEPESAAIVRQILLAVTYLHEHNVVHRDLKMENILLDARGCIKIIDFGLATKYLSNEHKRMTDRVGTLYSMAPQVLQGVYTSQCDLWSIGVVTYILLSGKKPFWGPPRDMPWPERRKIMVDRIVRCQYMKMRGPSWDEISQPAKEMCASLLQMVPEDRPTAKRALKSKWLLTDKTADLTCACLDQDVQVERHASLVRALRRLLAESLSKSQLEALQAVLISQDKSHQSQIAVSELKKVLEKDNNIPRSNLDSVMSGCHVDSSQALDYVALIVHVLESQGRTETERIGDRLNELEKTSSGKIFRDDRNFDADGFVSSRRVLALSQQMHDKHLRESLRSLEPDVLNETPSSDLVDAFNIIIPGGQSDASHRPMFVYDTKTKSVRSVN